MLDELGVAHETAIVSAHRTPDRMAAYAKSAASAGLKVIIAGAGGAAHLPGMVASMTTLPVLGVPVESRALKGLDSLLSIAQMPGGVPVATFAIGEAGAKNAALHAAAILGAVGCGLGQAPQGLARPADKIGRQEAEMRRSSAWPSPSLPAASSALSAAVSWAACWLWRRRGWD